MVALLSISLEINIVGLGNLPDKRIRVAILKRSPSSMLRSDRRNTRIVAAPGDHHPWDARGVREPRDPKNCAQVGELKEPACPKGGGAKVPDSTLRLEVRRARDPVFANSVLIPLISWKVATNWWLHQYFDSVASMYEDRFELYVLCRKKCEKPADNQAERTNWWKLAFGTPSVPALLDYVNISPFSLPARRTKELRALTGWRYYFSLFLELSDIAMPFIRAAVSKVSAAVSYFWVSMIGRSLGLIFSGIRQSLGWR
ncbi:hypothetical protein C2845_PM11G05830 [Panicum miliaceum]|uniref:Uncharacterized protein n=1 Tax=Panicum miliaceum TaxID=4540 RepID=A0A3L6RRS6_PANMI|nr:hypothetical protein C2845_PM11G05830 [Panicum miliaceum]